jgi:hypothetical protein
VGYYLGSYIAAGTVRPNAPADKELRAGRGHASSSQASQPVPLLQFVARPIERFTGAFVEELGKWAARAVIVLVVAAASGYILLPA